MTIQFVPASEIPFPAFVDVFNRAYQGYFIPIFMEVENMERLVKRDQIDLPASVVALENGLPIGVGMLAVSGRKGWIGGLGVVSSYRGLGLGKRITQQLIANAQSLGLGEIYLEVVEQNQVALGIYQSLNFQAVRRLLVLEALPHYVDIQLGDYEVRKSSVWKALAYYDRFHLLPNPWQRRSEALAFLGDNVDAWVIYREDILAYVVGWVWEDMIRFMDIGMAEGAEEALKILLQTIQNLAPEAPASISNLPEDEAVWGVLQGLNYQISLAQQEMCLVLG